MSLLTSSIEIDEMLSSELVKHSELTHLETLRSGDLERFFRFQNRFDLSDFNFSGITLLLLMPWWNTAASEAHSESRKRSNWSQCLNKKMQMKNDSISEIQNRQCVTLLAIMVAIVVFWSSSRNSLVGSYRCRLSLIIFGKRNRVEINWLQINV